jgi:hypothetical protein
MVLLLTVLVLPLAVALALGEGSSEEIVGGIGFGQLAK